MKRTIAIIDSGFDDRNAKVRALWKGFAYEKIDLLGEGEKHPHGTLVANLCFRPFDTDQLRDKAEFLHIRAGDAQGRFPLGAIYEAFSIVEERGCTAVNCSWGSAKPTQPEHVKMAERILQLAEDGVAWHWAAGNEDNQDLDEDISRPQALLHRGQGTYLWGALEKEGKPAWFSSDGDLLFASTWGAARPSHGPDGLIASVSGTSFASPTGCGLSEALMAMERFADYSDLEEYLLDSTIHLTQAADGTWGPYLNPAGEPWHPKVGFGSLEHVYQGLTVNARCRPQRVPKDAVRYFNFRRL